MSTIFTELTYPRYILLINDEIVKNDNGTIMEFKTLDEIEFYTEVNFEEGLVFKFCKFFGIRG